MTTSHLKPRKSGCPLFFNLSMERKRGRPKKPKRELRSKPLRILLNQDERQSIDAAARGESMETSTWARAQLLAAAKGK